jgi:uncharacterized protein (DUF433 family)
MINTVEHIQERNGEYYVLDTRVTVHSVIASWWSGTLPEHIVEQLPSTTLADVFGVISYYLDHQQEMDAHFAETRALYEREREADCARRPAFYDEMRRRVEEVRARRKQERNGLGF